MPSVYILIGPPGSGKSTWCERFRLTHPGALILSSDEVIAERARRDGLTYAQAIAVSDHHEIQKGLLVLFEQAILENRDIVLDRTNMSAAKRHEFLCRTPDGYGRVAMVFDAPLTTLAHRLQRRAKQTGKYVPLHVVEAFIDELQPPTMDVTPLHDLFSKRAEFTSIQTIRAPSPGWFRSAWGWWLVVRERRKFLREPKRRRRNRGAL